MPQPSQTLTDVVNIALGLLGHKPIQNIETPGRSLEAFLTSVVTSAIRSTQSTYPWPELTKVVRINPREDLTLDGYTQYPLPTELLRIVHLSREAPYQRRGPMLLTTGSGELTLHYIAYSDDPGNWSEYLTECIYTEMAARLAMPLTQRSALAADLRMQAETLLRTKVARAEQESRSAQVKGRDFEYVSILRGGSQARDNRIRSR